MAAQLLGVPGISFDKMLARQFLPDSFPFRHRMFFLRATKFAGCVFCVQIWKGWETIPAFHSIGKYSKNQI